MPECQDLTHVLVLWPNLPPHCDSNLTMNGAKCPVTRQVRVLSAEVSRGERVWYPMSGFDRKKENGFM